MLIDGLMLLVASWVIRERLERNKGAKNTFFSIFPF